LTAFDTIVPDWVTLYPKNIPGQKGKTILKNQPTQTEAEDLLTVREIAQRLRVDDTTVRRWIKNEALEAITLPHRGKRQAYRIRQSTLDKLLLTTTSAA
jgi:excisionase family DNA binding protein